MNDIKKRFETFNIYDYQGVEEHLSRMAEQGWRLEKTGVYLWTYRRAEPAKLHYAVTYSHTLSQFDPEPTEDQTVLADLCEAAGWEPVCGWNQMQIFVTNGENPVPLETDEALRLDVIHRTMKKHFFPAQILLLLLSLLMNASSINTLIRTPIRFLESNGRMFSTLMYLLLTLLLLVNMGTYLHWRRKSRQSIAAGGTCVRLWGGYRNIAAASLAVVLIAGVGYAVVEALTMQINYALFYIIYLALFVLLVAVVQKTKNALKKRGVSRGKNRAITLAVDILLAFALIGGLMFAAFRFNWFTGGNQDSYLFRNEEWDVNPISIPLTNADITGEEFDHVRRSEYAHGSFLIPIRQYQETALRESDSHWYMLMYEILEPKNRWSYDAALAGLMESYTFNLPGSDERHECTWKPEDPSLWNAEEVYQRYVNGTPSNMWVICWSERIASVYPNYVLSEEEMPRIGQALHP